MKHEDKCFPFFIHKTALVSMLSRRPRYTLTCVFYLRRATRRQMIALYTLFPVILRRSLFRRVRLTIVLVPKAVIDKGFMERATSSSSVFLVPKDRIARRKSRELTTDRKSYKFSRLKQSSVPK